MSAVVHFPPALSFAKQPKLGFRISPMRDDHRLLASQKLCFRSTISSNASGGNRSLGRNQRRRNIPPERPKRTPTGKIDGSIGENSSNSAKSNQEEIISIFKRIQTSISKGGSGSIREEKTEKYESSEDNEAMPESHLDVLSQPRNQNEGARGKKGPTGEFLVPLVNVKAIRPPSNFVRRSPIPSPSSPRTRIPKQKSEEKAKEEIGEKEATVVVESMKLSELKEVAKARGIKGYSKLKKTELLELVRSL